VVLGPNVLMPAPYRDEHKRYCASI
jgi:hypothetical protein